MDNKLLLFFCSPKGRINRLPFLVGSLSIVIAYVAIIVSLAAIGVDRAQRTPQNTEITSQQAQDTIIPGPIKILMYAAITILVYFSIILTIKRLHDINLSGWFWLIYFIPIFGLFLFLYLLLGPPVEVDNRYSPMVG